MKNLLLFPFLLLMYIIGFFIGIYLGSKGHTPEEAYLASYEFSRDIREKLGGNVYIFSILLWMVILSLIYQFFS